MARIRIIPRLDHAEVLAYMGISGERFWDVVDNARSRHPWEKIGDEWQLKHAVWMERDRVT